MPRALYTKCIQDNAGNIQPEARVRVFNQGLSTQVSVYDVVSGGLPLTQPLSVDSLAFLTFYIEPGLYDLEITIPLGVDIWPFEIRTSEGLIPGPAGPTGPTGPAGPGRSITSSVVNASGDLIITYSDATIQNAGHVRGDSLQEVFIGSPGSLAYPAVAFVDQGGGLYLQQVNA